MMLDERATASFVSRKLRENRVNQSGSVALNTEGVRGPYEPRGRGFESCRARQYSKSYDPQLRSFLLLRDLCGTFYPQAWCFRNCDAQHRTRFLPIQDQVRLLEQAANVGACVVPRHRPIRVAQQRLPILH